MSKPVRIAANAAATIAGAAAGWIAYSRFAVDHHRPLAPAVDAPFGNPVNAYADTSGEGTPLVLIHSINAAASSYEMRPLFDAFRGTRPVYALDLPGFGLAPRRDTRYSPAGYAEAIENLLASLPTAADVIALSLSSEFAARAAVARPALFRSLTMISPTGFGGGTISDSDTRQKVLGFPLWGQAFYDLLVSPPSLRYYLQKSFVGRIDPGLEAYSYDTSHQPGARFAPLYFLGGKLFTPRVREEIYSRLQIRALVLYDRDGYTDFRYLGDFVREHENWEAVRIPDTLGLPQFERLDEVVAALKAKQNIQPRDGHRFTRI